MDNYVTKKEDVEVGNTFDIRAKIEVINGNFDVAFDIDDTDQGFILDRSDVEDAIEAGSIRLIDRGVLRKGDKVRHKGMRVTANVIAVHGDTVWIEVDGFYKNHLVHNSELELLLTAPRECHFEGEFE